MSKINNFLYRFQYELFAALGAVIILWQMLLPGYVLTLDMVFGPNVAIPSYSGLSASTFLPSYLIYLLHFFLNSVVIEKVILLLLFFVLLYIPLRVYPFQNKYGEAYFVSIFYTINPFVCERFLAGQWEVLFAYAFLFPFVSSLIRFYRELSWHSILSACAWLLGIGMFSLHVLVMGTIILILYALGAAGRMLYLKETRMARQFSTRLCVALLLLVIASSYWLIPAFETRASDVTSFSQADWATFQTASDVHIGVLGNVTALYGFWEEHERWVTFFLSPKASMWLWGTSGVALAALICLGIAVGLYHTRTRFLVALLCVIGFLALVFSAGVGQSVVQPLNLWLFEHIWFWRGFRDTEKWSGVLVLCYALFGGLSIEYLAKKLVKYKRAAAYLVLGACLLPLLYTPTILFGFEGQLQPVSYPPEWAQANNILAQDTHCTALFLPWHQYYIPVFNNRVLTANTAPSYFDCTIISSANAEVGDITDQAGNTPQYYQIESAVTSNTADPDATVQLLRSMGVHYIIFTNDQVYDDPYTYPFLHSTLLHVVVDNPPLVLFAIP